MGKGKQSRQYNEAIDASSEIAKRIIRRFGLLAVTSDGYLVQPREQYKVSLFSGSPIGDPIPTVTILGKIDGNKVGKLPEDEERLLRRRGIHIDTDLLKMESQPSISSYAWSRIMELEESRTPSEEWNVGPVFYSPFLRDLDNLGLTLDPNL